MPFPLEECKLQSVSKKAFASIKKLWLKNIVVGGVFGLGFYLSVVFVIFISMNFVMHKYYSAFQLISKLNIYRKHDKLSEIEINYENHVISKNTIFIRGALYNNDGIMWENIEIEAELFDIDGDFTYECSRMVIVGIPPHQTEHILLRCQVDEPIVIPEFQSIELRVVNASYFPG